MGALAEAYVAVKPDTKDFGPQLRTQLRRVKTDTHGRDAGKKFGAGFGKMAAATGVGGLLADAAKALGRSLTTPIRAASDMNETLNKSNVIFGKSAGSMRQWASSASTSFGLTREQALAAASGFGDMFKQIGFSDKAAVRMSKSTVRLSADLGSFNNLPTADVQERIAAAFRGEYDSLQKVIPNINAARVEQVALATTGKKAASSLTAQEKAAAVLAIVQKDGARATGDFARTQGGLANQLKIAKAQLGDMAVTLGAKALPFATRFFGFLTKDAIPTLSSLGGSFSRIAGPVLKSFNSGISGSKGVFKTFADFLATHQGDIVSAFVEGGKAALGLGEGILRMASGGLRGIGMLDHAVGQLVSGFIDSAGSILRAASNAFGWMGGLGPKLKAASAHFDAWSATAKKGFAEQGKGALAAADKLDGYAEVAKATRLRLEALGKTEVWKARQRDAAKAARIAIKEIGTNADGSKIKLKKWSDVTKLGAVAQIALRDRIKAARDRMVEQRETGIKAGATQAQLTRRWDQGREALYKEFRQMGLSKEEAKRLTTQYGKIPKKAETKVTQPGMKGARGDTKDLDTKINNLNNKKVAIDFSTNAAKFGVVIRGSSGSARNRTRGDGPPLGADLNAMIGAPASAPGMHSGGPGITRDITTNTNSRDMSPVAPRFNRIGDDVARSVGKQVGEQVGKKLRAAIAKKAAASAGAPGGKGGKVKVGRGWGPIQAAMRAKGARSFTTYPGHHPSMARARDVTPHNWSMANAARALSSVWYVIYRMRIASKNHGNTWRRYNPTNTRGDFRHVRHIHVARYDQGGLLRPGATLALNGTGRSERVTPTRGGRDGAGGTYIGNITVAGGVIGMTRQDLRDYLVRELDAIERTRRR